jgi:hypothetical protein
MIRLAGYSYLFSGKLAKSRLTLIIAHTKPVRESVQIVRLGIIERNPKQPGQSSEALVAPAGVNYAEISLARNS